MVKGFRLPGEGGMSRAQVDKLVDRAKQLGAGGLVWMRVVDGGALESPVLKFLSEAEQLGIVDTLGAHPGDLLLVAAGPRRRRRPRARHACGSSSAARRCTRAGCSSCGSSTSRCSRRSTTTGGPIPAHHPFTMPHPDDLEILAHGTGEDLLGGPLPRLRPRAQRLGARLGQRADPPARRAAPDLLAARHLRRGRAGRASASCSTPSATARRRTPGSRSASTASPRSSRARTTSAR